MTNKQKITKINSTQYLTDPEGNLILNKDGSPRKKPGRPKGSKSHYNYSTKQKKKSAAKRALTQKRRTVEKLEKKLRSKKQALKQQETTIKKFENASDE